MLGSAAALLLAILPFAVSTPGPSMNSFDAASFSLLEHS
jgi:hypothetical protein